MSMEVHLQLDDFPEHPDAFLHLLISMSQLSLVFALANTLGKLFFQEILGC